MVFFILVYTDYYVLSLFVLIKVETPQVGLFIDFSKLFTSFTVLFTLSITIKNKVSYANNLVVDSKPSARSFGQNWTSETK